MSSRENSVELVGEEEDLEDCEEVTVVRGVRGAG